MRLLLDSHIFLWLVTGDERLSAASRRAVEDLRNEVFFSAASAWELSIKYRLNKLPLPLPPHEYVPAMLTRTGVDSLAVSISRAVAVAALPDLHRDPFDRLLVAQALHENLTIVTADPLISAYAVPCLGA